MKPLEAVGSKHIVLLIHGIRTQAEWQPRTAAVLESDPSIHVVPLKYGFLDIVRFLLPVPWFRERAVRRIETLMRDALLLQPNRLSVVCHSFGAYIFCRLLQSTHDLRFHRVILCGAIVPRDFPWHLYAHRLDQDASLRWHVVNDCGMKDRLPVLAESFTWGYGASGRFGFGAVRVKDRFHALWHSGFFSEAFVRKFWLPYLMSGEVIEGSLSSPTTPLWLSALSVVKMRWIVVTLVLFGSIAFARHLTPNKSDSASGSNPSASSEIDDPLKRESKTIQGKAVFPSDSSESLIYQVPVDKAFVVQNFGLGDGVELEILSVRPGGRLQIVRGRNHSGSNANAVLGPGTPLIVRSLGGPGANDYSISGYLRPASIANQ